jgi:hypothetical protein
VWITSNGRNPAKQARSSTRPLVGRASPAGLIAGFAPVTRGEDRHHVALMAIVRDVSTGPSRGFIFIDVNGERGSIPSRCYVLATRSWMAG